MKKRVLLFHPDLTARGGGACVGAWAIEALREAADLTVVSWSTLDCAALNRQFATHLSPTDFEHFTIGHALRRWLERLPFASNRLRAALLMRLAKQLDRKRPFDVLLCTENEAWFGRPGVQYVHYPYPLYGPESKDLSHWYHRIPGAIRMYRKIWRSLSDIAPEQIRANRTLVNSEFVARAVRQAHQADSTIVYPPVPGSFPSVHWQDRRNAFVVVGRFHPCKRVLESIAIVAELRRRGHPVTITILGMPEVEEYEAEIRRQASTCDWIRVETDLPRAQLIATIASHRYAIHAAVEEHFGIALAEQLRAGCIPFAHDSGGPPEILGGDRRLLFEDDRDAVERIGAVLRSDALQAAIRADLSPRAHSFTAERFVHHLRAVLL